MHSADVCRIQGMLLVRMCVGCAGCIVHGMWGRALFAQDAQCAGCGDVHCLRRMHSARERAVYAVCV